MSTDRRRFMSSALAAAAAAGTILPAGRLWADGGSAAGIPSQIPAVSLSGKPISLSPSDVKDLPASLRGRRPLAPDEG